MLLSVLNKIFSTRESAVATRIPKERYRIDELRSATCMSGFHKRNFTESLYVATTELTHPRHAHRNGFATL